MNATRPTPIRPQSTSVEVELLDLAEQARRQWTRLSDAHGEVLDQRLALGQTLRRARELHRSTTAYGRWLKKQEFLFGTRWARYFQVASENEGVVRAVVGSRLPGTANFQSVVDLVSKAPEYVDDVCTDKMSIEDALRRHRRDNDDERYGRFRTEARDLALMGQFAVIVADPPWRYEEGTTDPSRVIENHYPTMALDDICELKVPAADDAVLFLWSPPSLVFQAGQIIDKWGFDYRSQIVWVKHKIGPGHFVRAQHELLLIARRGTMPHPAPEDRPPSVICAPRGEHSAKPEEVYAVVERMYQGLPKVELFARTERPGWTTWGDQARQ